MGCLFRLAMTIHHIYLLYKKDLMWKIRPLILLKQLKSMTGVRVKGDTKHIFLFRMYCVYPQRVINMLKINRQIISCC